ncbi:Coatomer subunit zeta-1 [Rhizophlyctis rosea]|uniref:Coatomer subunit zeta n=1 Tax=Rhizophlyctis rosea TaxID=64517 RepID=A0AAD5S554_9FUNG|nr:Coatomer subunit zeta-1 [Rhizophlyctis rosea]
MGRPTTTSLYTTKAIIILDSEGKRLHAKYYTNDYPTAADQRKIEKTLFDKTKKMNSDIIMIDSQVTLYKNSIDTFIYLIGAADENELILSNLLSSIYEALMLLLGSVEKRTILEQYDVTVLAIDEAIDQGIILDNDPQQIASRVTKKSEGDNIPLSEQSLAQAFRTAQEQLAKSLLK